MKKIRFLTYCAVIAAAYAALTLALMPIAYGPVQFRVSEALTILPFFSVAAIPGLTVGCIISNLWSGYGLLDIVFGSLATLLAATATYFTSKIKGGKYLAPLPAVIFNALIVGALIAYSTNPGASLKVFYPLFVFNALTVGLGELAACYILGLPLLLWLNKHKDSIFK